VVQWQRGDDEKLGFTQEGRIRRGCEVGGQFFQRIKWALLREEWQARRDGKERDTHF
jgi:hypothetical protein